MWNMYKNSILQQKCKFRVCFFISCDEYYVTKASIGVLEIAVKLFIIFKNNNLLFSNTLLVSANRNSCSCVSDNSVVTRFYASFSRGNKQSIKHKLPIKFRLEQLLVSN